MVRAGETNGAWTENTEIEKTVPHKIRNKNEEGEGRVKCFSVDRQADKMKRKKRGIFSEY